MTRRWTRGLLPFVLAAGLCGSAEAGEIGGPLSGLPPGETVSIEPIVGYLRATSTENVYDPTNPRNKVSQLDWNANAVTAGARLAVRPMDGVTVRGRFWAAVSADANMTDRDWALGYYGRDSWTHQSTHADTRVPKAWQGDVSASVTLVDAGDVALTGIAGYRHYEVKYRAYGGSYIYSGRGYRDLTGSFAPGGLGISYEQWWDTPYVGIGAYYRSDDLSLSTELYGSPVSFSRDRDFHAARYTLFTERYSPLGMLGTSVGLEYQFAPGFSATGRFDYTRYLETKGGTKMYDFASGQSYRLAKPSAGADADTMHLTLGVKMRL